MNNSQRRDLLEEAIAELKKTKAGYSPTGGHWRRGMQMLEELHEDLMPPPKKPGRAVPSLGPIWRGGRSVLLQDLTHATDGLPLYPAFDDAFVEGRAIIAPEDMEVTRQGSSKPGHAFYATGKSKLRYWFGHLSASPPVGRRFRKGQIVGYVGPNTIGGGPHCHCGINVELLLGTGKELEHHTNYTHGAPTVGVQLKAALA